MDDGVPVRRVAADFLKRHIHRRDGAEVGQVRQIQDLIDGQPAGHHVLGVGHLRRREPQLRFQVVLETAEIRGLGGMDVDQDTALGVELQEGEVRRAGRPARRRHGVGPHCHGRPVRQAVGQVEQRLRTDESGGRRRCDGDVGVHGRSHHAGVGGLYLGRLASVVRRRHRGGGVGGGNGRWGAGGRLNRRGDGAGRRTHVREVFARVRRQGVRDHLRVSGRKGLARRVAFGRGGGGCRDGLLGCLGAGAEGAATVRVTAGLVTVCVGRELDEEADPSRLKGVCPATPSREPGASRRSSSSSMGRQLGATGAIRTRSTVFPRARRRDGATNGRRTSRT